MDEKQQDATPNNSDGTIIPPTSTTEYVDEPTTDIPKTDTSQNNNKEINKEPIQVTVNIPKDENRAATTANKIAIFGLFINLILAVFTYLLFRKTVEANETSKHSLTEAQKAVDQAKRANDIAEANFKLAQISSVSSDSISNINLDLTKKSVTTQIASIEKSQKEFELENRPLVQIADIKIDSIGADKESVVSFKIVNMGKFPATVTYGKFNLSVGKKELSMQEIDKKIKDLEWEEINTPISKETTIGQIMRGRPLSDFENKKYQDGEGFIFLIGEIKYVSFGTKNTYSTTFVFRVNKIRDKQNVVGIKIEDKTL